MTLEQPSPDLSTTEVEIQGHGIAGHRGRLRGRVLRPSYPDIFDRSIWLTSASRTKDVHAAFRGTFEFDGGSLTLRVQAPSTFRVHLDGAEICTGPLRYALAKPEFSVHEISLAPGAHRIDVQVHGERVGTRISADIGNFLYCELFQEDMPLQVSWLGREMREYVATGVRVSPLQGWVEWRSAVGDPDPAGDWEQVEHVRMQQHLGDAIEAIQSLQPRTSTALLPVDSGRYRDTFTGYPLDDLAVQFMLGDDHPDPAQDVDGYWSRYDLGKVRIGSLELDITTDAPAEVTIAYAEKLTPDGRPAPVVPLSTGPTHMLQHFDVGPGITTISPLQSLGARYLEVRTRSSEAVSLDNVRFVSRESLPEARGHFRSGVESLDRIWAVGIETIRSSAEDSLVDSVRERGEWVGDVVSSALHLLESGWGDYRLVHRALLHSAATARDDGLVAGCGPGSLIYLGTYACQWVTACVELAKVEGGTEILRELEEPARANIEALVAQIDFDGTHSLPWSFIDWGYSSPRSGPDLAVIAHVLLALDSWVEWQALLGARVPDEVIWKRARLADVLSTRLAAGGAQYHARTLAAIAGVESLPSAAKVILGHLTASFPFAPHAPRLRDPTQADARVTTPYFTNYSVPLLLRSGMGEDVRRLWEKGWGWMLDSGATTWWEVFDDRWSHCHYWSGSPTWQMTKYALGLRSNLTKSGTEFSVAVNTLGLPSAAGRVHLPGVGWADVRWTRSEADLTWEVDAPADFVVRSRTHSISVRAGGDQLILKRATGDLYAL